MSPHELHRHGFRERRLPQVDDGADLGGTDLDGADLGGADLDRADLDPSLRQKNGGVRRHGGCVDLTKIEEIEL